MNKIAGNPELNEAVNGVWGIFYMFPSRLISYMGAIGITACLFIFPSAIADSAQSINHSVLSLILLSTSAGFIHGSGFVPRNLVWKVLFSPLFIWPAQLFSLYYILA